MKLISWNVNGLRACVGKGFLEFFSQKNPDFLCLQETKLQEGQIDLPLPGYAQFWNYAEKKGYSGTAVFAKEQEHIQADVKEIKADVKALTDKPAKRWESLVDKLLLVAAGAFLGWLAAGMPGL